MAGKGLISVGFVIRDGKDGLKELCMDADALRKVMEENVKVAAKMQDNVFKLAATTAVISGIKNALGEVNNVLSTLTDGYDTFDKAMKATNTMAGKDAEGFELLRDQVADLSKQIPIARDELANGLYQVISNGVPEDNWIEFLKTSARSAVGGIADINKVVGVTSTVIKNYGMQWSAAADIQDKIQLTAKNGVTSFEQLAQALPRVTGNAATLGVSIDELMGTFATLTGVSGNTAEVSTQLAAIFTALVKPSSEAADMASRMGIQFDAAAIKAAGGFQNFLQSLDSSVKSYAAATGTLEQQVYAKLFGSAESLRALIPLQGELAAKFSDNVASMQNSAGVMNAAFTDMASTGEASTQMLRNQTAALTDYAASLVSCAKPYVNFSMGAAEAAANVAILIKSLGGFTNITKKLKAFWVSTELITSGTKGFSKSIATARLFLSQFGTALTQGTKGLRLFAMAWKGMLISTGIGLAVAAVTAVIAYFAMKTDEATESIEKLDDATDDFSRGAADAKVSIDKELKSLSNLINSKADATDAVKHLNDTYGDSFGTYKTAAEWYDVLTRKGQLYVKQKGYEAQAVALASKQAEAAIRAEQAADKMRQLEKSGKDKEIITTSVGGGNSGFVQSSTYEVETKEYKAAKEEWSNAIKETSGFQEQLDTISSKTADLNAQMQQGLAGTNKELKVSEMSYNQLEAAITKTKTALTDLSPDPSNNKKRDELKAYMSQLQSRKALLEKQLGLGSNKASGSNNKTLVKDPKTKEDLDNNIKLYTEKVTGEDTEAQRAILNQIAAWKKLRDAIEMAQKQADRPAQLETLEDIDAELNYQRTLRAKVSKDNLAAVDSEIRRLEDMRSTMEAAGHIKIDIENINTYDELNREISYYESQLNRVDATQRTVLQKHINKLHDVKDAWDSALKGLDAPADISALDTVDKLDKAISYYRARQDKASADEIANIQETIGALERKSTALQRGVELYSLKRDADNINSLTGRDYSVKIKGMGFDELTEKIRSLQDMLNDTENPVTASQRKDVEDLIETYEKWRKEGLIAFDTLRDGWDGIKGIGSGVESLTSVLEGNGNAWQTITGIVDGFLQIYDGISKVIEIINMMTQVTKGSAAAKTVESTNTTSSTAATIANTTALEANTVAASINTSVKSGESIAEATASGAKLPFPANLAAIAAGVAAVVGALSMIGSFATGGIVGGASPTGDKLIARVNSGEMILNHRQQQRLFDMLNSTAPIRGVRIAAPERVQATPSLTAIRAMLQPAEVDRKINIEIAGRKLVGVIANETRISGKSGKKTNIKL